MTDGPIFAAAAIALWIASLLRDLPKGSWLEAVAVVVPGIGIGIVLGLWRTAQSANGMFVGGGWLFCGFLIVTRGHVVRAVNRDATFITPEIRSKYMGHSTGYQVAGLAVGLSLWAVCYFWLGFGR